LINNLAVAVQPEPFDPHPQYSYGYSVSDALTGDQKSAHETRDGDVVKGQYSLVEPDGAIRTVTYTADDVNGFNAVVSREAGAVHVKQAVAVAAPVQQVYAPQYHSVPAVRYSAPVQTIRAQPIAYSQPQYYAPQYHAAPAVRYSAPAQTIRAYSQPQASYGAPVSGGYA
jgi:hypothetical protein